MMPKDARARRLGRGTAAIACAAALLACAACATTAVPAAPAAHRGNLVAADLYPLDPGWKWAYDLEKDGQTILAMYAVLERSADTATVQAGEDRLMYAISPAGIAQKDGAVVGDFVIKNPIQAGAGWPVAGGQAKIAAVGQSVTVTAGKFDDCVVVEATRTGPPRAVRTTFAPGIGPVIIELQIQVAGQFVTVTRATLRALTRPGQDPLARSARGHPGGGSANTPRTAACAKNATSAATIKLAARLKPSRSSARS